MRHDTQAECLACELTAGDRALPGGRIYETNRWVVEHCIGSLPVGTLIVKPFRHCLSVADLRPDETEQLGPLINLVSHSIRELTACDQVYICLWSHADWTPGHIHFVLQPAWNDQRSTYEQPGPFMQEAMLRKGEAPDAAEVTDFGRRARDVLANP